MTISEQWQTSKLHSNDLRILVEIMHGLGDTVCALPMVSELRRMYPSAYIAVLCKTAGGRQIIEDSQILVDDIMQLDIYKSLPHTLRTLRRIRAQHFDIGISSAVTPVRKSRLFMKACGVKYHGGLQGQGITTHSDLHNQSGDEQKYAQSQGYNVFDTDDHFVTSHIKSAHMVADLYTPEIPVVNAAIETNCHSDVNVESSSVNIELSSVPMNTELVPVGAPRLYVSVEAQEAIGQRCGLNEHPSPRIALCIGNADPSFTNRWLRRGQVYPKAWGIQHMKSLLQILVDAGLHVVLIGGPQEQPLVEELGALALSPQVVNLVGTCSVRESMAAIRLCEVSVGIDTGMQHIAAALGVTTVSIFGPTDPKRCGAYGEQSHFVEHNMDCKYCYGTAEFIHCPHRNCLQSITPHQVWDTIKRVLHASKR